MKTTVMGHTAQTRRPEDSVPRLHRPALACTAALVLAGLLAAPAAAQDGSFAEKEADVAAALDLSPGSVGTTVRRAELTLRKELTRHASSH